MAIKIIVLNNLVVQFDDTKYTDTFNEKVGGTMPAEIIKKADSTVTVKFYDNQVVKILQDVTNIAGTIVAAGNHTKITLP